MCILNAWHTCLNVTRAVNIVSDHVPSDAQQAVWLAASDFHQKFLGLCIRLIAPAPGRHPDCVISVILIAVISVILIYLYAHLLTHMMHVLQHLSGILWHSVPITIHVSIL